MKLHKSNLRLPQTLRSFVRTLSQSALLLASMAFGTAALAQEVAVLEVGDKAPDFSLPASDGETYSLAQFIGVKPIVIAFFPKAFTGG